MIGIVVAVVVALVLFHRPGGGIFSGLGIDGSLGAGPTSGGADGSPQARAAAAYSGTRPVGNSEQNLAHGFESAIGGIGGAAACTYYGAAALAPICAKVGSYLGPKAVALGNFTTQKTLQFSLASVNLSNAVLKKGADLGTNIADFGAGYADRAYAGAGQLPGPLGFLGQASLAPIKVVADTGAKVAGAVGTGVGALESGVKSAGNAVESGVSTVLGWL